jgi:hypothetical protein
MDLERSQRYHVRRSGDSRSLGTIIRDEIAKGFSRRKRVDPVRGYLTSGEDPVWWGVQHDPGGWVIQGSKAGMDSVAAASWVVQLTVREATVRAMMTS